ncbi:MAG: acetate--CoA ligase family protein [Myxococcota bacterium]|jgi:acetyltransferase
MPGNKGIIAGAVAGGRKVLDEFEAKELLRGYGVPVVAERACVTRDETLAACAAVGYPVVVRRFRRRSPTRPSVGS